MPSFQSILKRLPVSRRRSVHLEGDDHWDDVGPNQFEYLKREGLTPDHYLLEIPCGSFRAGRLFIDYLKDGHYYGVDGSVQNVDNGVRHVLEPSGLMAKMPT